METINGNIRKIRRQGDHDVIVWIYELPFTWALLKAEIQHELNQKLEDEFQVLPDGKIICRIKGGRKKC